MRAANAWPPSSFVRHGADSAVPLTVLVEGELRELDGGATELRLRETCTVRDGTWHAPFVRLLVRLWPAYITYSYAQRVKAFCEDASNELAESGPGLSAKIEREGATQVFEATNEAKKTR